MNAADFLRESRDPNAWRKHARALRRSGDVIWDEFQRELLEAIDESRNRGVELELEAVAEIFETSKLLYGLALETALKGWIVEHYPSKIEVRVAMDGTGQATQAELRTVGVPISSGHNLLALAEAADLFGERFQTILVTDHDRRAMRNICRELGEVVLWRGRYPVPLASTEPIRLDPNVPARAVAHYIRDWLDPVLDVLLQTGGGAVAQE
ncbi:hypothetical protein [Paraburkholderia bannensis]|uniref:hypothetical protein n=1 Tax=Paraburkholderia bannensis TaxID=765414 RepID=UPI002AB73924|nr:hypothetical protein [Paraburkholderia bannensis]